jgi:hypothetical protein
MKKKRYVRSGQAMVELLAGLVALVVLFAGLLQIVSLTRARTDALVAARSQAGQQAVAGAVNPVTPDYIAYWQSGRDNSPYSADDTFTQANASEFRNVIIDKTVYDPGQWALIDAVPDNRFSDIRISGNPVAEIGLIRGSESRTVPLIPTIRSLVYDAQSITIECEVWLPWTRGIY